MPEVLVCGRERTDTRVSRRRFLAGIAAATAGVALTADRVGDLMSTTTLLNQVTFGAFAANEPWPDLSAHYALESALGVGLPIMSWFQSWTNGWLSAQAADAARSGHDLLIALEPTLDSGAGVPFADILAGKWDRRLDAYFTGAAAFPNRVVIRMAHEMNLAQHPWSIVNRAACTSSLDVWLDTWRYVVDRQRRIGGNVQWQWCVNTLDMGGIHAEAYWPGADYVDSLSIDAYNGYANSSIPPLILIAPMYERLCALHPSAPIWLAEVGCRAAKPGELLWNKANWYADLFAITTMPRVEAISFFNMNKEFDWRITGTDVRSVISGALRSVATETR